MNVRSLIDIKRRLFLANQIATADSDIICLSESCLTSEIPDRALFAPECIIHRDRSSDLNTKHDGVLVAIRDFRQNSLQIDTQVECVTIEILTKNSRIVICCTYNQLKAVPIG